jgi:hypothetical protein
MGAIIGGATLTIHGTHFTRDAKVFFNSLQIRQVTRINSTTLRLVTPGAQRVVLNTALAQLHGLQVVVSVKTAGGTSKAGVAGLYTYL